LISGTSLNSNPSLPSSLPNLSISLSLSSSLTSLTSITLILTFTSPSITCTPLPPLSSNLVLNTSCLFTIPFMLLSTASSFISPLILIPYGSMCAPLPPTIWLMNHNLSCPYDNGNSFSCSRCLTRGISLSIPLLTSSSIFALSLSIVRVLNRLISESAPLP